MKTKFDIGEKVLFEIGEDVLVEAKVNEIQINSSGISYILESENWTNSERFEEDIIAFDEIKD